MTKITWKSSNISFYLKWINIVIQSKCLKTRKFEGGASSATKDNPDWLDVGKLRDELQQAGLELDGSREVLINRWKTLHERKAKKVRKD